MDGMASFGYWVRRRRKALDLTQEQLAQQVGCAEVTIKKIEADERRPSRQIAERLADSLQLAPAERAAFVQAARGELAADRLDLSVPPTTPEAAPLPGGTTTFLFTDIEGSTELWDQHPLAMPAALQRHELLLRQAIAEHRGVVFKTVGDAVCAAFASALDALAAALDSQRALVAEAWDANRAPSWAAPARADGAAHGRSRGARGRLLGPPLNRVARLLATAHGGQILLSRASAELVADGLPAAETLLPSLLNAVSARDAACVLVLDDYHVIEAPAIHAALTFLLDQLPPRLHLVIASRADPPLPLPRLRVRGDLTELRAADLRFTPADAAYSGLESALAWMPDRDGPYAAAYQARHESVPTLSYLATNLIRAFGETVWYERWAAITVAELRRTGFNTIANWSDWEVARAAQFPYVRTLDLVFERTPYIFRDFPDVFHPAFLQEAARLAEPLRATAADPALIGYFLMNEPSWGFGGMTPAAGMLFATEACATRKVWMCDGWRTKTSSARYSPTKRWLPVNALMKPA